MKVFMKLITLIFLAPAQITNRKVWVEEVSFKFFLLRFKIVVSTLNCYLRIILFLNYKNSCSKILEFAF